MGDYERRKEAAVYELGRLLDPQTQQEFRHVAWLMNADLETVETLTVMIRRGRQVAG